MKPTEKTFLGKGKEFSCYLKNNTVTKYSIQTYPDQESAEQTVRRLQAHQQILATYLDESVILATYSCREHTQGFQIIGTQNYIKGMPLSEFFERKLAYRSVTNTELISFFQKCLYLYEKTGHFPDIYGEPSFPNKFSVPKTENVIIAPDYHPYLIDPSLGVLAERFPIINYTMHLITTNLLEQIVQYEI